MYKLVPIVHIHEMEKDCDKTKTVKNKSSSEVIFHSKNEPAIGMNFITFNRLSKYIKPVSSSFIDALNVMSEPFSLLDSRPADISFDKNISFMQVMINGITDCLNDPEFTYTDDDIITIKETKKDNMLYTLKEFLNKYRGVYK